MGREDTASAPIGVFDSGIGGLSILRALRTELPHEHFVYLADTAHSPYGERDDAHVIERTRAVVAELRANHAIKALVIACNTATAAAIHHVREEHPDLLVVGVEPALKPAVALTRTGRIGVLATRATLRSDKLRTLHDSLKGHAEFVLQACDGLAEAIESAQGSRIANLCEQYLRSLGELGSRPGQIDTVVLGCTHYPFAIDHWVPLAGDTVRLVETGAPVARQARRVLELQGLLRLGAAGTLTLFASGSVEALNAAAARWLTH
jgi:glutamate racemase